MTDIKHMTHQGSHLSSSLLPVAAKRLRGASVPLRASLLCALLLCSGGAVALSERAMSAPSTFLAQTPLSAKIIYVNPATGKDSADAGDSAATPFRTIAYALGQAKAGTIVQVANGSYTVDTGETFPLIVPPGVNINGDESTKGQTVSIIGGGNFISQKEANQSVGIVVQQDSVISGVSITNPKVRGSGLWIESGNPKVTNNTFTNSKREGIFVTGTATPKIEANVFTKNDGNGISMGRNSKGEIRNNVFDATGFGIAISENSSPAIAQNRFVNNVDGIVIGSDSAPVLRNNVIENNKRDGIVVVSNAQPDLGTKDNPGQNQIRNNARYDLHNSTRSNTLIAYGNELNPQRVRGRVEFDSAPVASNFSDIQGHWAQTYIQALASKGIIAGFQNGTFRPSEPVTRAQFAAIINKAFVPAPKLAALNFVDVSSKFWAYEPIQAAYRSGFVSGYPGRKFLPNQPIPRVQVLVSLASGLNLRSENTNVLSLYNDKSQIPNYALTAVAGATQKQLVVNYPTLSQLNPTRNATRADVAAFVYQALVNAGRAEAIPSDYVVKNPQAAQP